MPRSIKHFSLHRIASTELRVLADVEEGVLPLIQAEELIIQGYARLERWPHRWITLFILEDLQPLVRQLLLGTRSSSIGLSRYNFSPADVAALSERPIVNIYDLADLTTNNIFVNHHEMVAQGYWDDQLALQGLFAHEHAHPLAENETTHVSRQVKFGIVDEDLQVDGIGDRKSKITQVLTAMTEKLSLFAPREIFANEMTIQSGFSEALLHLNLCNMDNASRSIASRMELLHRLQQEMAQEGLTQKGIDLLMLIGDLNSYLPLALEVAPFYRTGRTTEAKALEKILETSVFPYLDPLAVQTFTTLRDTYIALPTNLTMPKLITWGNELLDILFEVMTEKGLTLQYRLG
jgi:hypothetical protein